MAITRKQLSLVESARVVTLVESEFIASGKNDTEFAAYATEKLGFEVNDRQIHNRRTELGIKSRAELSAATPGDRFSITPRLEAVERQLAADQKEFRGLTELFLDLKSRVHMIEKALKLKGHFEGFTS